MAGLSECFVQNRLVNQFQLANLAVLLSQLVPHTDKLRVDPSGAVQVPKELVSTFNLLLLGASAAHS